MPIGGDLVFRILADKAQFDRTVAGTRRGVSSLVSFAKRGFAAIAVAYGGAFSIEKADQQAQAEKKLAAVLKSTGNAAGFSAKELQKFAAARQNLTNFGDEATINLAGLLATFKQIQGPVFKETIKLAQDMSAVIDQDLKSSAIQLGKALNDPILGLSALQRVGVSFTEDQKEQIRVLQESGDIMGAQRIILAELRSEFGGAAEAMASDWQQLKNELGDTAETIGSILLPVIKILNFTIRGANEIISSVTEGVKEFFGATETGAGKATRDFKDLRQEYKAQEDSLANIVELTKEIRRNEALQIRGQQLMRSGARGPGEFTELLDINQSDLGTDRLRKIGQLGDELEKLASPADKAKETLQGLFDTLNLLQDAEGVPGAERAMKSLRQVIDNQIGVTDAIKKAREELDQLTGRDERDQLLFDLKLKGASPEKIAQLETLFSRIDEKRAANDRKNFLTGERDRVRESLKTPFEEFKESTGTLEELFKGGFIEPEEFSKALAKSREDFNQRVSVNPEFTDPGETAGVTDAISLGTQESNRFLANALAGRDTKADRQIKNLEELNKSNALQLRAQQRSNELLERNKIKVREG